MECTKFYIAVSENLYRSVSNFIWKCPKIYNIYYYFILRFKKINRQEYFPAYITPPAVGGRGSKRQAASSLPSEKEIEVDLFLSPP